ncbi:hypothetical protein [Arthrobacter sp. Soil736]|nr:hypothetical protein [Arthrobacter sp. Soil736]
MSILRIEAIRLAHSLDEVLDEIRESKTPKQNDSAVQDTQTTGTDPAAA